MIVGKEVPEQPDLRYVRKAGESEIYIVAAKTDKLSTKFEDWIEPNLLKINTLDLKDVLIHDYAVQMDLDGLGIVQRDKIKIAYNDVRRPALENAGRQAVRAPTSTKMRRPNGCR